MGRLNIPKRCLRTAAKYSAPIVCARAKAMPINTPLALVTSENPVVSSAILLAVQSNNSGASSCVNATLNAADMTTKNCERPFAIDRGRCGKPADESE